MVELPKSIEAATAQALVATQTALDAGLTRIMVELVFPELKPMPIAEQFLSLFEEFGSEWKMLFPDAGAAALARRDWGEKPFEIRGLGELKAEIRPEDRLIFLVAPSSVEVQEVERVCEAAGDRPVIMLNPNLSDIANIGLGYAARQLRIRFLSQFESAYYLRPLDAAALLRCYPSPWQVWLEKTDDAYELIAEVPQKPMGDELERILMEATGATSEPAVAPQKPNFFKDMRRFLRALGQ